MALAGNGRRSDGMLATDWSSCDSGCPPFRTPAGFWHLLRDWDNCMDLLTDNVSLLQQLEIFGGQYSVPFPTWDVEALPSGHYNFTILDVLLWHI